MACLGAGYSRLATAAYQGPTRDALRVEAEDAARKALALQPEQPDALAVIAGLACREGRWEDCMSHSLRAVKGAPSDTMWRSWHAWHARVDDTSWLAASGAAGSLAAGAVVLGYYVAYWIGLRWRIGRHLNLTSPATRTRRTRSR